MTVLEYRNAITNVLGEANLSSDPITIIRKILDGCNADLPYGECKGILAALSEKNFERWVGCNFDEAKKSANDGVPTIAVNERTLFVIAPEGTDLINNPKSTDVEIVKSADSLTSEQKTDMAFFTYSGVRSTATGLVYISPSNQSENVGYGDYGTEKERMEQLATSLLCWFNDNGVDAKLATLSKSLDDRIAESKKLGASIYIPLHSNGFDGTATRPFTIYTNGNKKSKSLADTIQTNLHSLYQQTFPNATMRPIAANTNGYDFKEIRDSLISPAFGAYIEVAFHDNEGDANWIIKNIAKIAENIGESIKSHM